MNHAFLHHRNCDPSAEGLRDLPVLSDRFGRVHRSLRISVTDACNIRCQYCMPEENAVFLPKSQLLSFAQIECFVRAIVPLGISKIRLTGGEPLLRPRLYELVERLARIAGVEDLSLTTNGMLLAGQLPQLVASGLTRVNISLDTLSEATFKRISRREGLQRVLEGIEAALQIPQLAVKLNALVLRDVNLDDVFALVDFARQRDLRLRFIEFMPLDAERAWSTQRMVSGEELRAKIVEQFGPLAQVASTDPSRPSVDYCFASGAAGQLGFIDSVSQPFCAGCDRLRLTADGKIRNCLFGQEEWDVAQILARDPLDAVALGTELQSVLRESVLAKHAAHGIADAAFQPPARAMYQIGG